MSVNTANRFSRRAIVRGGVTAIVAAAGAQTTVSWADGGTPQYALSLTPGRSNTFGQMLDQYFPGLAEDPTFQQICPLCFIIQNQGSIPVKAHSVTWNITTPNGVTQLTIPQFFSPRWLNTGSPYFGVKGDQTRMTGQVSLIRPSRVRLTSPFFTWSPQYYKRKPLVNWPKLLTRTTDATFVNTLTPHITGVTIQLGAVVFADNVVIGQDDWLPQLYSAYRNAERDLASSIASLIASGAAPNAVETELVSRSVGQPSANSAPSAYTSAQDLVYNAVSQRQAKVLLARLLSGGWTRFNQTIQYIASQPKTVITAVS